MGKAMDDAIKGARRPTPSSGYFHILFWLYLLRRLFADAVNIKFGSGAERIRTGQKNKRSQPVYAWSASIRADNFRRHPAPARPAHPRRTRHRRRAGRRNPS
jgi:hypothetical protein